MPSSSFCRWRRILLGELLRRRAERPPFRRIDPAVEDVGGEAPEPLDQRHHDQVLVGQHLDHVGSASPAQEREQFLFLEGVVTDDTIECGDELLELLPVVGAIGIERLLRCGAAHPVLQIAEQHDDMKMLFVKHLTELAELRHRPTSRSGRRDTSPRTAAAAMRYDSTASGNCVLQCSMAGMAVLCR